ncbi:CU044_2847 family protein [Actinospica robiniae]|uniref:CU044_2847 family protein n=1 Tax=Actinospica robiniae TaxID=304901 RepID=UPI00040D077E|nr:CU044_2847 family protein [Actinospica robiniae]
MPEITSAAGNGTIEISVGRAGHSEQVSVGQRMAVKATEAMAQVRQTVLNAATEFASAIEALEPDKRPAEVVVQFGIELSVTGSARIASGQSGSNFVVSMKYAWPHQQAENQGPQGPSPLPSAGE